MYLNRWVLLLSAILGIAGGVALAGAFAEYRDAVRRYTQVEIAPVPGSVRWNADRTAVTLGLSVTNHTPASATVEYLDLRLYAAGAFAGADYEGWQPLTVASGASEQRALTLEISDPGLAGERAAGATEFSARGEARVRFAGVERPVTLRVQVPALAEP